MTDGELESEVEGTLYAVADICEHPAFTEWYAAWSSRADRTRCGAAACAAHMALCGDIRDKAGYHIALAASLLLRLKAGTSDRAGKTHDSEATKDVLRVQIEDTVGMALRRVQKYKACLRDE